MHRKRGEVERQVGMGDVLELAELHGGNWHAFEAAVRTTYFKDDEPALYRRLAGAPASPDCSEDTPQGSGFIWLDMI